ncbi:hypothetical protein [Oceanospirillum beijerinckii]|uniref:hypothetical protein n=1 Tax=Oceanospirillum beijerinckii TaxID=64976 RepID=UPI0004827160|nr:hypothetical protein [Oceanospirillum beijerinckii]
MTTINSAMTASPMPTSKSGVFNLETVKLHPPKELVEFKDPKEVFVFARDPDEWRQHVVAEGKERDVGAILRLKGEVVGMVNYDGQSTTRNSIGMVLGNGMSERISYLQSKYPGISVEIFERGQGPTNAEAHEIFSGKKYSEFIEREYAVLRESYLQAKKLGFID